MNGMIFMFPNHVETKKTTTRNQFVAFDVDSVALRHTMVYVWETLSIQQSDIVQVSSKDNLLNVCLTSCFTLCMYLIYVL